jgi:hypothetical protein
MGWAQTVDTGRSSGVVEDISGAVVPAAAVTIQNQVTGWFEKLLSDSRGLFVTPPLTAAEYDVAVEAPGFSKVVEHVRLEVAQRVPLEIRLTPGNVQEAITVEASAAQLATETSTIELAHRNRSAEPADERPQFR